jgi:hypothetical protein
LIKDYESIIIRYYWDAQYIRKAGFWLDLRIMSVTFGRGIQTLFAFFLKKKQSPLVVDKC